MTATWPDLMVRLTALGGVPGAFAVAHLDPQTRRLSLLRVAQDCEEAASAARLLAETEVADTVSSAGGGELWWETPVRNW